MAVVGFGHQSQKPHPVDHRDRKTAGLRRILMWQIIGVLLVSALVARQLATIAGSTVTAGTAIMLSVAFVVLLLVVLILSMRPSPWST
jgi:uncharacterized membrane protein